MDKLSQADHELLAAYLEGRLSPAEKSSLEARLRQERPLARGLIVHARSESLLIECASVLSVSLDVSDAPAPFHASLPRQPKKLVRVFFALVASIVLLTGIWLIVQAQRPVHDPQRTQRSVVASLVEVQGQVEVVEQSGEVSLVHPPSKLLQGQTIRTGGEDSTATLEFADGTVLILEADTSVRAEMDAKQIYHSIGLLHVHVAPQEAGRTFVVATPHAEIRVMGTRFTTSAASTSTRVELEEGKLQMIRQSDGASVGLEEGRREQGVRPDGSAWEIRNVSFVEARADNVPLLPHPVRLVTQPRTRIDGKAFAFAFSPDSRQLAIAANDRINLVDAFTGQKNSSLDGTPREVSALAFSTDSKTLLIASLHPARIAAWDLVGRQERSAFALPTNLSGQGAALSPNGKSLTWIDGAKRRPDTLRTWDAISGNELLALPLNVRKSHLLAYSSDSQLLASSNPDGQVVVTDRGTAKELDALPGSNVMVTALAVSSDGKTVAKGTAEGEIHLIDLHAREPVRFLHGYGSGVAALAFSLDGKWLAAGLGNGTIKVWNRATGQEQVTFKHFHHGRVNQLIFSPDGNSLASAVYLKQVHVWSIP